MLAAHLLGVTCPQLESSHSSRRPNGWTRFPRVSTDIDPVTASKRGLPFCLSKYHSSITIICLFPTLLQRRTKQGKQDPWTKQSIASGQICPEEPTEAELQRIPPLLFFLCRHYFLYRIVSLHHILHYTMYMIPIKAQLIPTLVFSLKLSLFLSRHRESDFLLNECIRMI